MRAVGRQDMQPWLHCFEAHSCIVYAQQKDSLSARSRELPSGDQCAKLTLKADKGTCTQEAPSGDQRKSLLLPVPMTN